MSYYVLPQNQEEFDQALILIESGSEADQIKGYRLLHLFIDCQEAASLLLVGLNSSKTNNEVKKACASFIGHMDVATPLVFDRLEAAIVYLEDKEVREMALWAFKNLHTKLFTGGSRVVRA